VPNTGTPNQVTPVGRIKLVNPEENELVRGDDGLFRLRDGSAASSDAGVKLASGYLEGSNVNVVDAMVDMIAVARQFDTQMKLLQSADGDARQAAQLLSVSG
jgi:flagellar basal-body rod protein FlgF